MSVRVDRVYTVTELNADSLLSGAGASAGYTLVADESTTSGSSPIVANEVAEIALTNTYESIKGSIDVTKNVTVIEELSSAYEDITAGKRFRVGLERWDEATSSWQLVTQTFETIEKSVEVDPNDPRVIISSSEEKKSVVVPWVQTITVGSGSTGSVSFSGLEMGTYRTFELADSVKTTELRKTSDNSASPCTTRATRQPQQKVRRQRFPTGWMTPCSCTHRTKT